MNIVTIALHPDGDSLAALEAPFGQRAKGSRILSVRTDGTGYRELSGYLQVALFPMKWTPDGKHILLKQRLSDAGCPLLQVPAQGGPEEPVGTELNACGEFDLSPDGARLVQAETAGGELWAVNDVMRHLQSSR